MIVCLLRISRVKADIELTGLEKEKHEVILLQVLLN